MSGQPLSVVHLLVPEPFGGLESVVTLLAEAQSLAGHTVTVAPVIFDPQVVQPFLSALALANVSVAPIRIEARQYLAERRTVRSILRERAADVLHTHGYRCDVVDSPVAKPLGVARVTTVHGYTSGGWKNRLYERIQTRRFRDFDAVVAVSVKLRGELVASRVPDERVHVVQNAWHNRSALLPRSQAREILGLDPERPIIAWIGRVTGEKAPEVMIQAMGRITSESAQLSMIGTGSLEAECRSLAATLRIDRRIRWHGLVPSAASLLQAFDVLVLTSWTEGTPMVLLEAMAAGIPIVTTAVGGIPEVVSSAEAHLCSPGAAGDIAAAIDGVLMNRPAAQRRADAARARLARDFAVAPWAARYLDIYRSVARS